MRNAAEAARAHSDAPSVSLSFAQTKSRRVQIEIADNGSGVPETLRHDIFLPFFPTKEKGTGVGLSLARQIVLAHRGSIDLTTSDAGGAPFRILIYDRKSVVSGKSVSDRIALGGRRHITQKNIK